MESNHQTTNIDEDIAISPLAIPILAGPGTIVTAMKSPMPTMYILE
nr:MarC family protein [Membranihabitans marinus]